MKTTFDVTIVVHELALVGPPEPAADITTFQFLRRTLDEVDAIMDMADQWQDEIATVTVYASWRVLFIGFPKDYKTVGRPTLAEA